MSFTTIRMAVGRVVLVSGILVLLFIPFLLWGTGLMTARSQAALRAQFVTAQHRTGSSSTKHLSAPKQNTAGPAPLQLAPVIADPAVGSPVGTIYIPKISLSMVVVEGTDEPQLQLGPGHYPSTPLPGEAGNAAIAGHRTTYLAPFYNLDALVPGDTILVTTVQGTFLYQMTGNQVVDPSDVAVVAPTSTPQLTLTTCNPRYSASQRLVVHAALVASALSHPNVVAVPTADVHRVTEHRSPPTPPARNWTAAILWGSAVAALTVVVWMATRRTHGGRRALIVAAGGIAWLVVVFSFFTMVAPLLPASY